MPVSRARAVKESEMSEQGTLTETEVRKVAEGLADKICDLFEPGESDVGEKIVDIVLPAIRSVPPPPMPALDSAIYGVLRDRFNVAPLRAVDMAKAISALVVRATRGTANEAQAADSEASALH
jgi:hypothetical protein